MNRQYQNTAILTDLVTPRFQAICTQRKYNNALLEVPILNQLQYLKNSLLLFKKQRSLIQFKVNLNVINIKIPYL